MIRRSPHVKILGYFGEVVFLKRRDREISDDCDIIVFGLLIVLGFEDDVVKSNGRTVRVGWHCESFIFQSLCCPLAEVPVAGLPQVDILADCCIFFCLI